MLKKFMLPIAGSRAARARRATPWPPCRPPRPRKLGAELTPLGAEKAGNADGSIPAWDGGITSAAQAGFAELPARASITPIRTPSDKPLFTVTPANMGQYASKLTEGHKKLLQTYKATFKMNVYPTHRSAAAPAAHLRRDQAHRDHRAARQRRQRRHRAPVEGIPFPIPKEGVEVFWNHVLRYRGDVDRAPDRPGAGHRERRVHDGEVPRRDLVAYSLAGRDEAENLNNTIAYFIQETVAPARLAGEVLLVQETLDQSQGESPRLGLQPRPAPRAPRAERRVRQSRHELGQPAHVRPVRHVQRQPAALRLDAGRQERNPRSVQLLQAQQQHAQVRRHPQEEPHQPGPGALRAASRVGRGLEAEGRPEPSVQPPHAVRGRRQLADPRGRLLRQPRPALSRAGRPRHQLLRRAGPVDRARDR